MKIGLFGGAFDPPHTGHKIVADSLIHNKVVDEVWFVPVFEHPWAKRYGKEIMTPYQERVHMLEFIVGEHQSVEHFKDVSFTFPTLEYFKNKYPEHQFSWIMGSEYISRFEDFLSGHPGLKNYTFYVYPRKGFPLENVYSFMVPLHQMKEIEISSTMVRNAVKSNEAIDNLVPEKIKKIIKEKNLYKR